MNKSLRIVFMGTPEFAVASLDALHNSRHKVIAVVTAPDRPANRGLKLQASAVKEYALKNNIPVLQPEKLKDEHFIAELKSLNPDLFVVIAFRMLPEAVWSIPPYGTINLHASLLPQYRGAAPINWAIINGEKETGVTTFFINKAIDTGDILFREIVPVSDTGTAGSLHDKLMQAGSALVIKTVDSIAEGTAIPQKQVTITTDKLKSAPKIFREDCKIDWSKDVTGVYNLIRGLSPYPGAWTELENIETGKRFILKIYNTAITGSAVLPAGGLKVENNHLYIGCNNGSLDLLEIQAEGKKAMHVADFLRGFHLDIEKWKINF